MEGEVTCQQCDEKVDVKYLCNITQFLTERATVKLKVCITCYERLINIK